MPKASKVYKNENKHKITHNPAWVADNGILRLLSVSPFSQKTPLQIFTISPLLYFKSAIPYIFTSPEVDKVIKYCLCITTL